MKFDEMREKIVTDKYGFKFIDEHSIMLGSKINGCMVCGGTTEYIDICSEGYVCSTECQEEFYRQFNE